MLDGGQKAWGAKGMGGGGGKRCRGQKTGGQKIGGQKTRGPKASGQKIRGQKTGGQKIKNHLEDHGGPSRSYRSFGSTARHLHLGRP